MKNYFRYIPLITMGLIMLLSLDASAQRYKKHPTTDEDQTTQNNEIVTPDSTTWQKIRRKVVFGGGAGAAFSTGGSFLEISPLVGYRITDKWQAGVGGTYIRAWGTRYIYDPSGALLYTDKYATSLYGGRVYSEYDVLKQVFLHGEYEALNIEYYDYYKGDYARTWIGNPLVGAGFRSMIGSHASFNILALYNLNYAQNGDISPYPSPLVLRMNFTL